MECQQYFLIKGNVYHYWLGWSEMQ